MSNSVTEQSLICERMASVISFVLGDAGVASFEDEDYKPEMHYIRYSGFIAACVVDDCLGHKECSVAEKAVIELFKHITYKCYSEYGLGVDKAPRLIAKNFVNHISYWQNREPEDVESLLKSFVKHSIDDGDDSSYIMLRSFFGLMCAMDLTIESLEDYFGLCDKSKDLAC